MYSDILEELISMALEDGTLTEQKRNMIIRRAEKEGEDPEEVIMIVEARLRKLGAGGFKEEDIVANTQEDENEDVDFDLDADDMEEDKGIYVPTVVQSKVLELVKKYNENAFKWGYSILVYDDKNQMLYGSFKEKNEAKGFWNGSKEAYRNGYLKEDFEKIIEMCGQ